MVILGFLTAWSCWSELSQTPRQSCKSAFPCIIPWSLRPIQIPGEGSKTTLLKGRMARWHCRIHITGGKVVPFLENTTWPSKASLYWRGLYYTAAEQRRKTAQSCLPAQLIVSIATLPLLWKPYSCIVRAVNSYVRNQKNFSIVVLFMLSTAIVFKSAFLSTVNFIIA